MGFGDADLAEFCAKSIGVGERLVGRIRQWKTTYLSSFLFVHLGENMCNRAKLAKLAKLARAAFS